MMYVYASKCEFGVQSGVFLGHEVSSHGIKPPPDKIEIIQNYPVPCSRKELQKVMGLFNWFRKYIPNYSVIANPLYKLLKPGIVFNWSDTCQESFDRLKSLVVNSEALAFPRFDLEFRLAVDTCSLGIGYMLYQVHENGNKRVVRFGSKGLTKWQRSYGPTKLELLGMVTSILDCASYLRGHHFVVECDHQALKPLFQKQFKGVIYELWFAILQQFDFDIVYKPAAQMVVTDVLSRNPVYPEQLECSPVEEDAFFPYVCEPVKTIRYENDDKVLKPLVNKIDILKPEAFYDADTEDNIQVLPGTKTGKRRTSVIRRKSPYLVSDVTKDVGNDLVKLQSHLPQVNDDNDSVLSAVREVSDLHHRDTDSVKTDRDLSDQDVNAINSCEDCSLSENHHICDFKPTIDSNMCGDFLDKPRENECVMLPTTTQALQDVTEDTQLTPAHMNENVDSRFDVQTGNPIEFSEGNPTLGVEDQDNTNSKFGSVLSDDSKPLDIVQDDDQPTEVSHSKTTHQAFIDLNMTPDSIRDCQDLDPMLKPIIDYLKSQVLPESQKKAASCF